MVAISESAIYSLEITRVETTDVALGGNEVNVPNKQFKEIADRTAYLKAVQDGLVAATAIGPSQGRLSLSNSNPLIPAAGTSTTLYYHPLKGNRISLYDSGTWVSRLFSLTSLSFSGDTNGTMYDIFAHWNGSNVVLEKLAWTNPTTRATDIDLLDGIYVQSGNVSRRYLGTVYFDNGQLTDTVSQRFVWNIDNQIGRVANYIYPGGQVHTYGSSTWRIFANDPSQSLEIVNGLPIALNIYITAGVSNRGTLGLGVNFPSTSTVAGFFFEQATASGLAPITLGGSQALSVNEGLNEFHLIQRTQTTNAADYATDGTLQVAGLSSFLWN